MRLFSVRSSMILAASLAEAALLNRLSPGDRVAAGTRLKRVIGEALP